MSFITQLGIWDSILLGARRLTGAPRILTEQQNSISEGDPTLSEVAGEPGTQFVDIMEKLGRKLATELPHGARVVSNAFPIPGLPKDKQTTRAFSYIIGPKP
jgi:hypothetical protein